MPKGSCDREARACFPPIADIGLKIHKQTMPADFALVLPGLWVSGCRVIADFAVSPVVVPRAFF